MSELMPSVSDPELTQSRSSLNGDGCGEGLRAGPPLEFCSWPCVGLDTGGDAAEGEEEPLPLHLGTCHCEVFLPPAVVGQGGPRLLSPQGPRTTSYSGPGSGKAQEMQAPAEEEGIPGQPEGKGQVSCLRGLRLSVPCLCASAGQPGPASTAFAASSPATGHPH